MKELEGVVKFLTDNNPRSPHQPFRPWRPRASKKPGPKASCGG